MHYHLRVLRRRKWIVLLVIVLVPAAAIGFSLTQKHLYQASAEVLLSRGNLANSLNNVTDPNQSIQADRLAQTQADLAQVPQVAQAVLDQLHLRDRTAGQFLASSSVSPKSNADLLVFSVTDPIASLATSLATAYAGKYIVYRKSLDTGALVRARTEVESRIARLEAARDTRSALYANLVDKDQQLRTMEALQTSNATLIQPAGDASQVQPQPVRNGILGLVLGLVLGFGLAFLREALDTRIRSADDIPQRLNLPLLARVPQPPRALRSADQLVMMAEPDSRYSEPFRVLRTNLELVNLDRGARTIAITSAMQEEGKSTTVANLAVALALAGRRVVLVDLDFRRPYLDRFFGLQGGPGLTSVALGHAKLNEALIPFALSAPADADKAAISGSSNGSGKVTGTLAVICTGPVPPDPGEFMGSHVVEDVLAQLSENADVVLIDAPPLLGISDTMVLSTKVDALLVVVNMNVLRQPIVTELRRVLDSCPAEILGFILTGVEDGDGYGYGYGYGYERAGSREQVYGREGR